MGNSWSDACNFRAVTVLEHAIKLSDILRFEDEVRLDTWYIENWSLWLDLYIALKTPFTVLYRKGVY